MRSCLVFTKILFLSTLIIPCVLADDNLPTIINQIKPSIVSIQTYDEEGNQIAQGSGFFINNEGHVITNYHVVEGAARIEIKTGKGTFPVNWVLAEDKKGDLILIAAEIPQNAISRLPFSTLVPQLGERIVVMGSPFGLDYTVSDGIVSALREIPEYGKIIQFTAPISPGSSGSPVINMKGNIIGIVTYSIVEGQNLNFAIPIERIVKLKQEKKKTVSEWRTGLTEDWLTSSEGIYHTAFISYLAEDYEKALNYLHEVLQINLQYVMAYFLTGTCYSNLSRYQEAIEAYQQAIRIKPDFAEAFHVLGLVYGKLGRYQEEIEAYQQAIRIQPDYAEAHFSLGTTFYNLSRYQESINAYKQVIRIQPDYAEAHFNLGDNFFKLGRYQEAIKAYKQAIRINPDNAEIQFHLGIPYYKLGQYQEAIEIFKLTLHINPQEAGAYYLIGASFRELGRYEEAIEAYKQAIRIKPEFTEVHYDLGNIYIQTGDKGSALDEYKILKELDKELANELFNLIY